MLDTSGVRYSGQCFSPPRGSAQRETFDAPVSSVFPRPETLQGPRHPAFSHPAFFGFAFEGSVPLRSLFSLLDMLNRVVCAPAQQSRTTRVSLAPWQPKSF